MGFMNQYLKGVVLFFKYRVLCWVHLIATNRTKNDLLSLTLLNGLSLSHLGHTRFVNLNLNILSKQASSLGYANLNWSIVYLFIVNCLILKTNWCKKKLFSSICYWQCRISMSIYKFYSIDFY